MQPIIEIWRVRMWFLVTVLVTPLVTPPARGTSYDFSPRQALFLPRSGQFLAQDAMNGAALYRLSDRTLIRSFRAGQTVRRFAITSDEKILLMAGKDNLSAHDLTTGQTLWELSGAQSGLSSVSDVSFSHDGRLAVACGDGKAVIFEVATGSPVRVLPVPPSAIGVVAAALSPDGTRGVLEGGDWALYEFDVATGQTKLVRAPDAIARIRYSADGKHVAFWRFTARQICISGASGDWPIRYVALTGEDAFFKPDDDGGFLLQDWRIEFNDQDIESKRDLTGLRWRPGAEKPQELWRCRSDLGGIFSDFLPDQMIGIYTKHQLVTRLTDLRTGAVVGEVDNSANYRRGEDTPTTVFGVGTWLPALGLVTVLGAVAFVGIRFLRRAPRLTS
jgi:WD40 repeat protein